jgi:hypothetical protein
MNPNLEVLEFGRKAVNELTLRLEQLQVEWTEVSAKRNAWMVILGNGENEPDSEAQPAASVEEANEPLADSATREKSDMARQVINNTGESGFKPKYVTVKLEAMGVTLPSGFVSNLLFRMKKKGDVVEHNGKYYLPKFDPKPRLNLNQTKDQGATEAAP